ncbi:helix-turn-helix transcriptional regulator [Adhaeretor mobilis]|uniref:Helix-turn-helix domain-containing protein n=1 Tax=Adhaeretor mobilis TaxID=1930276 RepID=A0A517MS43_9BACT|nr:helix-turn-helix domain-containing protein [Adhaeretor mobilis]QDS97702.1 hypothetical protein HG15A2_09660 [Adhaeretor mobilis]
MQHTDPIPAAHRRLLTRPGAKAYLAVSQRKLDSLVAAGEIPVIRIGTCVRFDPADLEKCIATWKSA